MNPPILLTMADFYGTLSAVRCLGRRGVPVEMAEWRLMVPAKWSRFVTARHTCPPVRDASKFLAWLLEEGAREPGRVLYPTSDDLAFLYSLHQKELGQVFKLHLPPASAVMQLLDKRSLYRLAEGVGLAVPKTQFPDSEAALDVLCQSGQVEFPVLVKPRSQVLFKSRLKGAAVTSADGLREGFRNFLGQNTYEAEVLAQVPDMRFPMVQRFLSEAAENIYSISGFIDEAGTLAAGRAAVKVLQRPRKLGIGLCFEDAPLDPALWEQVKALCQKAGYFGAFEVELIRTASSYLLIDFNPRFFGQMAFDVSRGMPLPHFCYLDALGESKRLQEAVELSQRHVQRSEAYCHRFTLALMTSAQRLSGRMTAAEAEKWKNWVRDREDQITDPVEDPHDALPGWVDRATYVWNYVRYPRSFLRTIVLDR